MTSTSSVLTGSVKATSLNIVSSVLFRVFTFLLNAFILRRVSKDVLGIVNVRLSLLDDTILFLSREAFRRSCLSRLDSGNKRRVVNLIWIGVPSTIFWALILGKIWLDYLPEVIDDVWKSQYRNAVLCIIASTLVQSFSEVFFIVGQVHFFVKLRAFLDFLWILVRCLVLATGVVVIPEQAVLVGGYAHLIATIVYVISYVTYFAVYSASSSTSSSFPFRSLADFAPTFFQNGIDSEGFKVTIGFYKQGILKMILTEGERYVMTFFDLMTLADQGVYDAVNNLGSLAARFIFRNVEEGAFLYFGRIVGRLNEKSKTSTSNEETAAKHLQILLRGMTILSLVILTFGWSYSHLALDFYGGSTLSSGVGPTLLRGHCVMVVLLAINGVSESFVFATMNHDQIDAFNYRMIRISGFFLLSVSIFSKLLGPIGFLVANACNFIMRIGHHYYYITNRYKDLHVYPFSGVAPSFEVAAVLIVSGVCCGLSESYIYVISPAFHVILGGCCFVLASVVIIGKEDSLRDAIGQKFRVIFAKKAD